MARTSGSKQKTNIIYQRCPPLRNVHTSAVVSTPAVPTACIHWQRCLPLGDGCPSSLPPYILLLIASHSSFTHRPNSQFGSRQWLSTWYAGRHHAESGKTGRYQQCHGPADHRISGITYRPEPKRLRLEPKVGWLDAVFA